MKPGYCAQYDFRALAFLLYSPNKTILRVIKASLNMQNNVLEFVPGVASAKVSFRPVSGFRVTTPPRVQHSFHAAANVPARSHVP